VAYQSIESMIRLLTAAINCAMRVDLRVFARQIERWLVSLGDKAEDSRYSGSDTKTISDDSRPTTQ
jgi:hypothetical protein